MDSLDRELYENVCSLMDDYSSHQQVDMKDYRGEQYFDSLVYSMANCEQSDVISELENLNSNELINLINWNKKSKVSLLCIATK